MTRLWSLLGPGCLQGRSSKRGSTDALRGTPSLCRPTTPAPTVRELMEACGWRDLIPAGASVAVKPNLCTERPEQIHTANTSAGVLRAVCEVLRERTDRVTIVESDGARYKAETAFENNGVYKIAQNSG